MPSDPGPFRPDPTRDPARLLAQVRAQWPPGEDLWIFAYASLIWRPECAADEQRPARLWGYHRALRMRSTVNRGSPSQPGLVFALLPGGSCRGLVYRIRRARADTELPRLWDREMTNAVYDPRWMRCLTTSGPVRALAFTLDPASPSHTGAIDDAQLLSVLRTARGRYGTTLEYLLETHNGLRRHGIIDRHVERMAALARRHGLQTDAADPSRLDAQPSPEP